MGGMGSGNWYRYDKKSTVEESLVLSVGEFYRRRRSKCSGTLTWTWTSGKKCSIGFDVSFAGAPTITLSYRWRDSEDVRIAVPLEFMPTQFGGERIWFTCPLIVSGVACSRRVGKLYLPPGAKYFGCRKCHGLTYRSCQEAHQAERLFAGIGGMERWLDSMKSRRR